MTSPKKPQPNDTLNPGDKTPPKPIGSEDIQLAVDVADITGDHIEVPTYFEVEYEDGSKEKLHHIKDAEKISDVIRQARTDEKGNKKWW